MSTEIVTRLKALKLHGMASNWPELVAHCRHAALEPEQLIEQLLDAAVIGLPEARQSDKVPFVAALKLGGVLLRRLDFLADIGGEVPLEGGVGQLLQQDGGKADVEFGSQAFLLQLPQDAQQGKIGFGGRLVQPVQPNRMHLAHG